MGLQTQAAAVDGLVRDEILERMEGDVDLLDEIVQLFIEDCPHLLTQMKDSIETGDGAGLRLAAHAMKGSLSNFGSLHAGALACELETMGKNGELTGAAPAFESLVTALEHLQPAMENLVSK
jgi:two-component system sensor histidine kinase/response regulator